MLILRERIKRTVECDNCKGKSDSPGYTLDGFTYVECPNCDKGTRTVVYEVEASGLVFTSFPYEENKITGFIIYNGSQIAKATVEEKPYMSIPVECFGSYMICEQLAGQLLELHLSDKKLPPTVTITEVES